MTSFHLWAIAGGYAAGYYSYKVGCCFECPSVPTLYTLRVW